jgi:hypothetical protein
MLPSFFFARFIISPTSLSGRQYTETAQQKILADLAPGQAGNATKKNPSREMRLTTARWIAVPCFFLEFITNGKDMNVDALIRKRESALKSCTSPRLKSTRRHVKPMEGNCRLARLPVFDAYFLSRFPVPPTTGF